MARSRAGDESAFGRARVRRRERAVPDPLAAQVFPQPRPPQAASPEIAGAAPEAASQWWYGVAAAPNAEAASNTAAYTSDRGTRGGVAGAEANPRAARGLSGGRSSQERASQRVRDALSQYGIAEGDIDRARRLSDTLREAGKHAMHAVRTWAEPREREMRRRRRARRRSLRWGTASGITAAGTAGLAVLAAPVWAVVVVGGGTVVLVTGAAVSTRRYLTMRRNPLPQAAFVPRKLPPVRSIAREPIARLVRAEEAFHALIAQIARGGRLSDEDLADTLETAASSAAALHALAADLVALEKTAGIVSRGSVIDLSAQVRAGAARLTTGVAEYEHLVAAASRILAAPEPFTTPTEFDLNLLNLRDCADRLDGWAQALADLA